LEECGEEPPHRQEDEGEGDAWVVEVGRQCWVVVAALVALVVVVHEVVVGGCQACALPLVGKMGCRAGRQMHHS